MIFFRRIHLAGIGLLAAGLILCMHPLYATAMGTTPNATIDGDALAVNDVAKSENVKTSAQETDAKSADDIVRGLIDAYYDKHGIIEGYDNGKKQNFYSAIRAVGVNTASPDFGKSKVVAFDYAYGEALKSFVKSQVNVVSSETVTSFFADASTNAGQFSEELAKGKSTIGAVIDKLIALGDAITSDKLRQHGIDPEQYNAAAPDRKKVLLSDSITKAIVEKSTMRLGGVVPVQTFCGDDGKGNQSVGVVILYTPKLQAIADALRRGQKPALEKQGPPLRDLLPLNDPAKLNDLLGVRVLFDEQGVVIVSYGQWSSSYKGTDPKLRSRYVNTAYEQAESNANAQIAEFLSTNFSSQSRAETGAAMEDARIKSGKTGDISNPDTAENIVDIRTSIAKRHSKETLRGAATLKRWAYKTPEGHEIVGVIKVYSFSSMEGAKAVTKGGASSQPAGTGTPSGRTGQDQMDISTF